MKKYYLAIDIGASSGRHIVGWEEDGKIITEEVYRFPNGTKTQCGHLVWDIANLFKSVKKGIKRALSKYPQIRSLAIDAWGVDYVLMTDNGPFMPCLAYRDSRTIFRLKNCIQRRVFSFSRSTPCISYMKIKRGRGYPSLSTS